MEELPGGLLGQPSYLVQEIQDYKREVAMVAGPYLRFALEACCQQFIARGYPLVGEDTSFLNFELVLDTTPDPFVGPALTMETGPIKLGMILFDLGNTFTKPLIMAWVCFSEEDLDHILGKAEAEVRGDAGQAAAKEGRVPHEGLPPPGVEDILSPSGEAPRRKRRKRTSVARLSVWHVSMNITGL
ncbi:UNVERIFIED_CONTAM: hypothetical protein Sangu_2715100 [Sesamum angustifolium]|uniref:Uncharacterized protein n=1 Tax=Sesamum angustifolium TaxID=2727405 RepID=A0AAW2IYB0_9LAMI